LKKKLEFFGIFLKTWLAEICKADPRVYVIHQRPFKVLSTRATRATRATRVTRATRATLATRATRATRPDRKVGRSQI
jgi:hypothetical protein